MPAVATRALILQSFPYSDSSKILRLYTRDYGVRSVIAKGAQRPRSRFGGVLEPFTEGEAAFYLKPSRELHTLGSFDLLRTRQELGRDLRAFAGASLLVELLLRFATEEPSPPIFTLAATSLDQLAAAPPTQVEGAAISAVWQMISTLGFRPQVESCVSCGRNVPLDQPARFDPAGGGLACAECRPGGRVLDPVSRAELRGMLDSGIAPAGFAAPSLQGALLRAFLHAQLAPERPLRSLELFIQQLGR